MPAPLGPVRKTNSPLPTVSVRSRSAYSPTTVDFAKRVRLDHPRRLRYRHSARIMNRPADGPFVIEPGTPDSSSRMRPNPASTSARSGTRRSSALSHRVIAMGRRRSMRRMMRGSRRSAGTRWPWCSISSTSATDTCSTKLVPGLVHRHRHDGARRQRQRTHVIQRGQRIAGVVAPSGSVISAVCTVLAARS